MAARLDSLARLESAAPWRTGAQRWPVWFSCTAALLIFTCGTGCGPSEAERSKTEEAAAQESYQNEYQEWFVKDADPIVARLIALRAPYFSPRPPSDLQPFDGLLRNVADPTLAILLNHPEKMAALDLQNPRQFREGADIPALIGRWRCPPEDDSLHTVAGPGSHPLVPCRSLANALVLREGRPAGDWLLLLTGNADCQWLSIMQDAQCFDSLKSWMAASVVGAKSRWDWLDVGEPELVKEMLTQRNLGLVEAVAELRADQPYDLMNKPPELSQSDFVKAAGDYPAVLRELGTRRPAVILADNQTYRTHWGYSDASALVRVWNGNGFSNLRLRPNDFDTAIAVVAQQRFPPVLMQLAAGEKVLYLEVGSQRAFEKFKDWVDYGRAQERVWRRTGFSPSYNAAYLPIG